MDSAPFALALTADDVRGLVSRRQMLSDEIAQLDERINAIRVLLPADVSSRLLGGVSDVSGGVASSSSRRVPEKPLFERAVTDLVLWAMEGETGGRGPKWVREKLLSVPEIEVRIRDSHSAVGNALMRLASRGLLSRKHSLYYTNEAFAKIERGVSEDDARSGRSEPSFNSEMHRVMKAYGKPFVAAEAIACAKSDAFLAKKLNEQPSRAYSWISRELGRGNLIKDGDRYSYPSLRDGALNGHTASAPFAGEVTASPINGQGRFDSVLG